MKNRSLDIRVLPTFCLTLALGACATVGPDYRLPDKAAINAPAARGAFVGATYTEHAHGDLPDQWWRLYDDAQLNRLVEEALAANVDLRVASANLSRSEAIVQEAEGAKDIKAGASATAVRAREAGEAYIIPHALPVENLANAGIRLSYQIDLVGGLRRAAEAAEADAEASRAALDLARISVAADVTQAYAEACSAGHELTVAEQAADLQQKNLEAVTRLVAAGRGMAADVPRADALVAQSRAAIPAHIARRRVALYRLAVLTGHPPADYPRQLETCSHVPQPGQPIPLGDGTALLRRRPDVRQAERSLAAATARVGVATAALYPTVTLGLSAGATGLLDHMGQAGTRRWSFGPLISWTIPGDEEKARVRQADAGAEAALARFDAVVLRALQEIESDLALLARDLDRNSALRRARDDTSDAARQVRAQFAGGRLPYLDDLNAQRALTEAEAALAASDAQVATDQIRVFLALGGGWER